VKRVRNPSEDKKDSGQAGMTELGFYVACLMH